MVNIAIFNCVLVLAASFWSGGKVWRVWKVCPSLARAHRVELSRPLAPLLCCMGGSSNMGGREGGRGPCTAQIKAAVWN